MFALDNLTGSPPNLGEKANRRIKLFPGQEIDIGNPASQVYYEMKFLLQQNPSVA
jgi:hypothetical protein